VRNYSDTRAVEAAAKQLDVTGKLTFPAASSLVGAISHPMKSMFWVPCLIGTTAMANENDPV
jgi:hypothetical protein